MYTITIHTAKDEAPHSFVRPNKISFQLHDRKSTSATPFDIQGSQLVAGGPSNPHTDTVSSGLGMLEQVTITLDSSGDWFPTLIQIVDEKLGVTYVAQFAGAVAPGTPTNVPLAADVTTPDGMVSFGDRERTDLSRKLIAIGKRDAVRFTFNHAVNPKTFKADRPGRQAKSLSIRYMDDDKGEKLTGEVSAKAIKDPTDPLDFHDWTPSTDTRLLSGFGTYLWEDAENLLIAPPEGDWPPGKYVRFEFDRSLADNSGNNLQGDRDQVIFLLVMPEVQISIDSPFKERTYLKWESGDKVAGDPEDFYVRISGTVTQSGAANNVKMIHVTARHEKGKEYTASGTITPDANEYDELEEEVAQAVIENNVSKTIMRKKPLLFGATQKRKGTKWVPDNAKTGGKWTINLPLGGPDIAGGALAVDKKLYKWHIEATVETLSGVRVASPDKRIVYHEVFKPRVTKVTCIRDGKNVTLFDHPIGGAPSWPNSLEFKGKDKGAVTFLFEVRGDFEGPSKFYYSNTYGTPSPGAFPVANIEQSDDVAEGTEEADVTLPTFTIDDDISALMADGKPRNSAKHTITFNARTKARSVVLFALEFKVDTLPLELVDAEPVEFPASRVL